jgi:monomeric sarcosine oxidase
MQLPRREFVKSLMASAAFAPTIKAVARMRKGSWMKKNQNYDVAVIGAGVFGAWTAYHLQRLGQRVALLDSYGPANSRASSGGESRIIRMGYGADEIYTRWSLRSLELWQEFSQNIEPPLFHPTGVLWLARDEDPYTMKTLATLEKVGVRCEKLSRQELEKRYQQIAFGPVTWAIFEPESGALMARRAVQTVVQAAIKNGLNFLPQAVASPIGKGKLKAITTQSGEAISAGSFVFACGPWLPKIFPDLLRHRIHPTRQEVFFFGAPAGDRRFAPPALPIWIDFGAEVYGLPDLENRGFKIALDRHGPAFDPDTGKRVVTTEGLLEVRRFLARRFPALKDAPVVEARVCQYENTSNGDFLIDRHPDFENVWLVGGGSGHGFKHGPALGEYVAARIINGGTVETRFTLATKGKVQKRAVY